MRTICLAVAAACCVCSAQGAEPAGWERLIAHDESERELRAEPTITLLKSDGVRASVLVKNRTGADIEYSGYRDDTPLTFRKGKRDGKWVATHWDWCSVGMKPFVLKDGKSITFDTYVGKGSVQVFVIFRNANDATAFSLIKLYERDGR